MRDINTLACWLFALCKGARPQRSSGCAVIRYDFRVGRTGIDRNPVCCSLFLGELRS